MTTELQENPSTSELFDDTSPSKEVTSKEETSPEKEVEEKVDEKVVDDKSEEKSEEKESESAEKSEEKKETDETKDDTSSKTDDKPSTTESDQLKEARKWGNEKNQEAINTKKELTKLREEYGVDDTPIDDTETATRLEERIKTSEAIERKNLGDEFIDKTLYADDSIWQQVKYDPIIDMRVKNSDSPISEALQVVKETEFHDKYGNDPEKIVSKIKEELKPELMKELKLDFQKKLKDKNGLGTDLSDVKSDEVSGKKTPRPESTKQLFG